MRHQKCASSILAQGQCPADIPPGQLTPEPSVLVLEGAVQGEALGLPATWRDPEKQKRLSGR